MARDTSGITIRYGAEGTTSSGIELPGAISIDEVEMEINHLDCRELRDSLDTSNFVRGLGDITELEIEANHCTESTTAWDDLVLRSELQPKGREMWLAVYYPDEDEFFVVNGMPQKRGFGGATPDTVSITQFYFRPSAMPGFVKESISGIAVVGKAVVGITRAR